MVLAGFSASIAIGIAMGIIFWQFIFGEERHVKIFFMVFLSSFVVAVAGYVSGHSIIVGLAPWSFIAIAVMLLHFRRGERTTPRDMYCPEPEDPDWDKWRDTPRLYLVVSNNK